MQINGRVECKGCGHHWDNFQVEAICPDCESNNLVHTSEPVIYLCPFNNTFRFGSYRLSSISKQIIFKLKQRDVLYQLLQTFLAESPSNTFIANDFIKYLEAQDITDGDVVHKFLSLCVCEGRLKKEFMKDKRFHLFTILPYTSSPCPHLSKFSKGKRIGVHKCGFSFKEEGKSILARDFHFPK